MHKWIYFVIIVLIAIFIYMVSMPFVMLYNDDKQPIEEVSYYLPEGGLESQFHKEVEMAKGKRARAKEAAEAKAQEEAQSESNSETVLEIETVTE